MKYISTRGDARVNFSEGVLLGLTPKGGLLVPETFPHYSNTDLEEMRNMSYRELALRIIKEFAEDIPLEDLKRIIEKSYSKEIFKSDEIVTLKKVEEKVFILELFNGPTLAFKDIALQFLGNMFEYILQKENKLVNILVATSGDTGSAAIYGTRGKNNIKTFVLTPFGKMSKFQTAQMYSVIDDNVFNVAVEGNFDECQSMVKAVSEDSDFKTKYHLGYMNSINWCRILSQIVYYAKGVFDVQKESNLNINSEIDIVVPTGNFGNILAGYYAKKMGIPIRNLILATNENDVLDIFFKTGNYKTRKKDEVMVTDSPSMDIASASNFERFIFDVVEENPETVTTLWKEVKENGQFNLAKTKYFQNIKKCGIISGSAKKENRYKIIKEVYENTYYIIDPHTANGVFLAKIFKSDEPLLCLATASPIKFEETMKEILGNDLIFKRPKEYENLEEKPQKFIKIDAGDIEKLKKIIEENSIR